MKSNSFPVLNTSGREAELQTVFSFHDYREYLNAWVEFEKSTNAQFTISSLAEQIGMAQSSLSMALSGARNFADDCWKKLMKILPLKREEQAYLGYLRDLADTDDHRERIKILEKIQKFRGYRDLNPKVIEVHRYLTHWYYVAIREMAALPGFKLDAKWIQSRLRKKVSLAEIRDAIGFLVGHGYIRVDPKTNTASVAEEKDISCVSGVYRMLLENYIRETLSLAEHLVGTTPASQRDVSGVAIPLSMQKLEKIKEILQKTRKEILQLQGGDDPDKSIFYVYLSAFPVTKAGD